MEPPPATAATTAGVGAARRGGESGTGGTMEPSPSAAPDLLSSLPEGMRDEVLVRLDLRDAVRTSALSRAWRHFWKSLSVLSLSFPKGTPPSAVDSVLRRYTGPRVSRFAFVFNGASAARVDDWLIALESIDISGELVPGNLNLHSIFSCNRLVSLELSVCEIPPFPVGFTGFPALQALILRFVHFRANVGNQLEVIIRQSPLLHDLKLICVCFPDGCPDSLIQVSNLHSLRILSLYDYGWRIGELPCLEDADLNVSKYREYGHDFGHLLARFAQVRNFTFFSPVHCFHLFSLFYSLAQIKVETLVLDIEADLEFLNAQWTDGMCPSLQVVQMSRINRLPTEISFMKLILSKAKLLRTLYVDEQPYSSDDPLVEILNCKRASAQARVLLG
ncbi:hypothetical protein U9M48_044882 [Paspalum notatum var. saurae]|uniref:F-box domain-containing protein n=1 Tax=Paspalum notatum var. saurae TaxID=547442 RepID=A0AAQ3XHY1_PASNO